MTFDFAEVSPRFDSDDNTAKPAAVFIFALVNSLGPSMPEERVEGEKGNRYPFLIFNETFTDVIQDGAWDGSCMIQSLLNWS